MYLQHNPPTIARSNLNRSLYSILFRNGIPKNVTQIRTIWPFERLLAANIVEQNIGQHLSEPEFHAESSSGGLVSPN